MSKTVPPDPGTGTTSSADSEAPGDDRLSLDTIFEALKNERRRRVVAHLGRADGPLDLGEVAERIAAAENDKPVAAVDYDERKRVYVALYQCHLPKMDDMGIVSFERTDGTVSLTDRATQLEPYLGATRERREWYRYYGGAVAAGVAVLVGGLAAGLATATAASLALGVVLAGVGACTAVHAWSVRGAPGR